MLVWQTAQWAGIDASWSAAVLVTTVAVAAQIAAFAPGGFGTYEAAAVAAWVAVGHDPADALVAALAEVEFAFVPSKDQLEFAPLRPL